MVYLVKAEGAKWKLFRSTTSGLAAVRKISCEKKNEDVNANPIKFSLYEKKKISKKSNG